MVVASTPSSQGSTALRGEAATRDEIGSVVDISFDAARHETADLTGPLADVPLKVHARYQREEILAASTIPRNPNSMREGVWYSREKNIDVLLITLKKSEADYSPTTMYRDYPISPTLFHWESQSTTSWSPRRLDGDTYPAQAMYCCSRAKNPRSSPARPPICSWVRDGT